MNCYKVTEPNTLPEDLQCRYYFEGYTRKDDENLLYWKCNNCGTFTSLNASNVGNIRDTGFTADEFIEPYGNEPIPSTSESTPLEPYQSRWQAPVSLQVPESSMPQDSNSKVQDTDTVHRQTAPSSNFGDQCNLRYPVTKSKLDRCYNLRKPLRAQWENFRFPRQRMHAVVPSRRFFSPIEAKQYSAAHRNGARMQHLNEALLPGYSYLYSQRLSNTPHEVQNSGSAHAANSEFVDQEPCGGSFANDMMQTTDHEPHTEHHCSMGYNETVRNYPEMHEPSSLQALDRQPYGSTLNIMTPHRVFAPDGAFSYRIPRKANRTTLAHESFRYSHCSTPKDPYNDSHTAITSGLSGWREGWERSPPPPPQPQCYSNDVPNANQKDCRSTCVRVDCQTERGETMQIRPCCCLQHCTKHGAVSARRFASLNRKIS